MITGIILASGFSRRMKADKLLIDIEGSALIERVIKACVDSRLDDIILIYRSEEVKKIGEKYNIKLFIMKCSSRTIRRIETRSEEGYRS